MDRNYTVQVIIIIMDASLSARRAWIEIPCQGPALRGVHVALRKESVDRNDDLQVPETVSKVALRKESVDRNMGHLTPISMTSMSLSARRAWIEIGRALR